MRAAILVPTLLLVSCGARVESATSPHDAAAPAIDAPGEGAIDAPNEAAPVDTTPPYPDGPYGLKLGDTYPDFTFPGYRGGTGDWTTVSLHDDYDPDGSRGITGVFVTIGSPWCGPCVTLAKYAQRWFVDDYAPRGAKFLHVLLEDKSNMPADRAAADAWVKAFGLTCDVGIDPRVTSMAKVGKIPHNLVIDPRTMRVVRVWDGINPNDFTECTDDVPCCTKSSGGCTVDYACSLPIQTCMNPGGRGPIDGLDLVMERNGAPPFVYFPK